MILEIEDVGKRIKRGSTPEEDKAVICLEITVDVENSKSDEAVIRHALKGIRSFQHQYKTAPPPFQQDAAGVFSAIWDANTRLKDAVNVVNRSEYHGANAAYWRSRLKMQICGIMAELLGSI